MFRPLGRLLGGDDTSRSFETTLARLFGFSVAPSSATGSEDSAGSADSVGGSCGVAFGAGSGTSSGASGSGSEGAGGAEDEDLFASFVPVVRVVPSFRG